MNINFNNSIVIITGGASGIGKSISDNFYQMGATVLVLDYDDDKVKYINEEGGESESSNIACLITGCTYEFTCNYDNIYWDELHPNQIECREKPDECVDNGSCLFGDASTR